MRTINAPGIEWREIDKSGYSPAMTGTACWIPGFSDKGEPYKPMEFTNRTALVNYYGEPDNEAERYFYAACCEVLNQNGRLWTCRLPYDNEAFEKMVGFKYYVQTKKWLDKVEKCYSVITDADKEISSCAVISTTATPATYSLAEIDEYRTNETKVPAGTFLIVDTTGATYGKVEEDYRKGDKREVIGIVPVVTTAANAMYAQSLIQLDCLSSICKYEPLNEKYLKTLSSGDLSNGGLLETDLVKKLNTCNLYKEQLCSFTAVPLSSEQISDIYILGDTLGNWKKTIEDYIDKYDLGQYDVNSLQSMKDFASDLSAGAIEKLDTSTANKLSTALVTVMAAYASENTEIKWYIIGADGNPISNEVSGGYLYKTGEEVSSMTLVYESNVSALAFAPADYINPKSITWKDNCGMATMMSATALPVGEWHGIAGDDSIPATMSLDAGNYFSTIQPASDGDGFDPEHLKDIGVVVYKTYLDPAEGNKVSWEPVEAFCGSLYKDDKDPNTGVSKFIDTIINTNSQYINFFSNCFCTIADKKWYKDTCDILISKPSTGGVLGFYESMTKEDISISKSIYDGLNKGLDKVKDLNLLDIDIICDAGLANIASYLKAIYGDKGPYDLTVTDDLGNSLISMWKAVDPTNPAVKTWKTVEQKIDNFCKNVRKDCMFVADGLRPLVLQGDKKIIRDSKPGNTIDANILPYLKTITGLNTSYCGLYMDWFEMADDYTGDFFWCPPSIKAMGVMINTDVNYNYWDAPAGLNRGRIAATDVAFSPTIQQAGAIYEKCINYAVNYPNDGIVLEGQKTTQVKPSAFDRINVRRLFCRLERMVYKVSRYFLYEGNTAYTRQRYVDAIDPYFKECKLGGGCYDYKIVCDESNNTSETIDRNELHVSIGIKPVKAIEFIMIDFVATSTGASWAEVGL